nr:Transketolase [Chlamydiota bacterium]
MSKLDPETKKIFSKIANTVRDLSMDAVQKANSGHPGLPLGCAELGAYLYGHALRHNPKNSKWMNRDRFVLSAGHGSIWLYSLLHLSGFNLSLEDIKNFRQFNSKTPGHPEYGMTDGVETTTGPLGQGTGNAAGFALGLKLLEEKFNTPTHTLFDAKVFCLAGDGDMMEGVSSEVASFAGHLNLNNLICLYDSNHVTLDGPLDQSCSEDTMARYRAYGWDVYEIDGYDFDAMHEVISKLREKQEKPAFILAHTIIGKGSPHKAGTNKAHGSPLGEEEVAETKANLGLPPEDFYIPQAVKTFFENKLPGEKKLEEEWNETFRKWSLANPELRKEYDAMKNHTLPEDLEAKLAAIDIKSPEASRSSSNVVIQTLADLLPQLYGGSADLSGSDKTHIDNSPLIAPDNFSGRNVKFGIREFCMGTVANGFALTHTFTPFVGTFLIFSDYMRNSIRLACLSKIQVIYHFTHDSFFLGEDGPTHQPIEQVASLRAIPNLHVIRPADNNEVKMAWYAALTYNCPTALILSRQHLRDLPDTNVPFKDGVGRGAYIIRKEQQKPDYTLFATGSEVALALDVAEQLDT